MSQVINMKLQTLCVTAWIESLILKLSCFKLLPAVVILLWSITLHRKCQLELFFYNYPHFYGKVSFQRLWTLHWTTHLVWCCFLWPGFKGSFDLDKQTVSQTKWSKRKEQEKKTHAFEVTGAAVCFLKPKAFLYTGKKSGKMFAWSYSKTGQTAASSSSRDTRAG